MTTYTENCSRSTIVTSAGLLDKLTLSIQNWIASQHLKFKVQQERQQLLEMSDTMLKDIGIGRIEAEQEAQRTDMPATRLSAVTRKQG